MRKFLFLNPYNVLKKHQEYNEPFVQSSVELLNQIIKETDCKLVILGLYSLDKVKADFEKCGIIKPPYDTTRDVGHSDNGDLVQDWLNRRTDPEDHYCIIDDLWTYKSSQSENTVIIDYWERLSDIDVRDCINILTNGHYKSKYC